MKKANFESGRFFSEEQIFFDKRHCPAGRSSTVNWHDYIEIIYFLDGEGSAFLEDRQYSILPETLIAVGPQTIHSITGKTEMPYYIIFIHQSFFLQNGIDPEALKLPEYTVNDQKLEDIFAELYEASRSDSFRQAKINSACLKLILHLCDNCSKVAEVGEKRPSRAFVRAKEIITFLKMNFDQPLTLDIIAKEMNINKYQLTREFKQSTNVSIFEFLNSHRCNEAKKLLKSGLSVSETAAACGFENLSYFSRTYKKYIGVMPIETKRQKPL